MVDTVIWTVYQCPASEYTKEVNDAIEAQKAAGSCICKPLAILKNENSSAALERESIEAQAHGLLQLLDRLSNLCLSYFPAIILALQMISDITFPKELNIWLSGHCTMGTDSWYRIISTYLVGKNGNDNEGLDVHNIILDKIMHLEDVIPVLWPGQGNDDDFWTINTELLSIVDGGGEDDDSGDKNNLNDEYEHNKTAKLSNIQESQHWVELAFSSLYNPVGPVCSHLDWENSSLWFLTAVLQGLSCSDQRILVLVE